MPTNSRVASNFCRAVVLAVVCAATFCLAGQQLLAEAPAAADTNDKEKLAHERDRLWLASRELGAKENWPQASEAVKAALAIQRVHFARDKDLASAMLEWLTVCFVRQENYNEAVDACRQLTQLRTNLLGGEHVQTVNARLALANYERLATLKPAQRQEVSKADALTEQATALHEQHDSTAALEKQLQALDIHAKWLGRDNVLTAMSYSNAGLYYLELGQMKEARKRLEESAAIRLRISTLKHPDTLATLSILAQACQADKDFARAEELLKQIAQAYDDTLGPHDPEAIMARANLGALYNNLGRPAEAEPNLVLALRRQEKVFGENHAATAQTRLALADVYRQQGRYAEGRPLAEKCVALFRQLFGNERIETAQALRELGRLDTALGQHLEAERALEEALAIAMKALGETNPGVATAESDLARLRLEMGDYAGAERYQLHAVYLLTNSLGEGHVRTAMAQADLARVYISMQDHAKALPYLLVSWQNLRGPLGENHPTVVGIVGQLAGVYDELGYYEEAQKFFQQAIAAGEKCYGAEHEQMAALYHNLARLDESLDKHDEAHALYLRSLRIMQAAHGDNHPTVAVVRSNFARSLLWSGQFAEARDVANKAIAALDKLPEANLPVLSESLLAAGAAELALGETTEAARKLERGLDAAQRHLDATATVESQRQQLVHSGRQRTMLDMYLSAAGAVKAEAAYTHVLAFKGATLTRARHDRKTMNERARGLAAELQRITVQYASMTLRVPKPAEREAWYQKLFELALHQEALEAELAHETTLARGGQPATIRPIALQAALPSGTALIDILEYQHVSFIADGPKKVQFQPRLVAFVVRPDQPIVRVELGWSKPVDEAVERWRRTRGFLSSKPGDNPAATLGEIVWQPLAPLLEGCETILVSPDAALARMPWGVLPGREPSSYLIEDLAIGMITVPQLVPELLAERSADRPAKDSLLLIGDVDYDAPPDVQNVTAANGTADTSDAGQSLLHFDPLAATGDEIHALERLFRQRDPQGQVLVLEKATATEAAFREAAPGYRWLHLATHGYFAPPNVKSALVARARPSDLKRSDGQRQPTAQIGFSSGLALTGANLHAAGTGDDGILMAAELATFDLHAVEVAVLSGCETGLGEIAGGEGTISLQRALQVAGVRTVVSSLWTVPDKKTDLLMQRFYTNLWDKKLPKLAALREAQLWMLRTGGEANPSAASSAKPLAPHYWAAFILSGDWR